MAGGPGLDHCEIRATQVLQPLKRLHFREACWVALEALIVSKEQQQLRGTEREVRAVAMPYQHCPSRDSFSHRWNSTQQRFSERFWEQFTFSGGMYMFYISHQPNLASVKHGGITHDCKNAVVMAQCLLHFGHGHSSGTVQNGLLGSSVRCSRIFERSAPVHSCW